MNLTNAQDLYQYYQGILVEHERKMRRIFENKALCNIIPRPILEAQILQSNAIGNYHSAYSLYSNPLLKSTIVAQKAFVDVINACQLHQQNATIASIFNQITEKQMRNQEILAQAFKPQTLPSYLFDSLRNSGIQEMPLEEFRKFIDSDLNDFSQNYTPAVNSNNLRTKKRRFRLIAKTKKLIQQKACKKKMSFYFALYSFFCALDPIGLLEYKKYIYLAITALFTWFLYDENNE